MGSCMVCTTVLILPWRIGHKLTENRVKIHSCSERTPELNEVCARKVIKVGGQFVLGIGQFFAERESWSEIAWQNVVRSRSVSWFGRLPLEAWRQLPIWSTQFIQEFFLWWNPCEHTRLFQWKLLREHTQILWQKCIQFILLKHTQCVLLKHTQWIPLKHTQQSVVLK